MTRIDEKTQVSNSNQSRCGKNLGHATASPTKATENGNSVVTRHTKWLFLECCNLVANHIDSVVDDPCSYLNSHRIIRLTYTLRVQSNQEVPVLQITPHGTRRPGSVEKETTT